MNSKQRFNHVMKYLDVDRTLYFEEGIRNDVLIKWGISKRDFYKRFEVDFREELISNLDVKPLFKKWPCSFSELKELKYRLNPNNQSRLPENFKNRIKKWKNRDYPLILRVHRGFFLSMGVYNDKRFLEVMELLTENPEFVKEYMMIYGKFAASLANNILNEIDVDAVIFSEPIGSCVNSLISPKMYEDFVLNSYLPLLEVCNQFNIHTKIFLTYANASVLIPSILKYGINCLWACEVNCSEMDYLKLRIKYGKDLRLIGGIDLDTLLKDKESIKNEILNKVPILIKQGGYLPLADGRIRSHVPFENYLYYRELMKMVIRGE